MIVHSTVHTVRTCAGGHTVSDASIIGMVRMPDKVELFCTDHAAQYDARLVDIGGSRLEM